ncbi:MAG: NAD(P)/FAD-dependent oxidoreductase [Alphaproteobacteria bacterium]
MTSMITEARPIQFSGDLPDGVDVVIIGGGVAGVSTAYFLAKRGQSVLLCEKGRIAAEQSSRNWGWVRQQGRDPAELPIMMEANRIWQGLAAETGESDLSLTQTGCLYLAGDQAALTKYEGWKDVAKEHQLDTHMLTAAEVKAQYPYIAGEWAGGMVTPSDGRAEPFVAVPALARAAERAGAIIREACAVRTLDITAGAISGVVTEAGLVRTKRVVLAGGAWSTHFAGNAGLNLPQLAVRSTVMRTEAAPDIIGPNVSTPGLAIRRRADGGYSVTSADLAEHFLSPKSFRYFAKYLKLMRVSAKDVKIRMAAPKGYPGTWGSKRRWTADETSPFETMRIVNPDPSPVVVQRVKERLGKRFPDLAGVGIAEAWAGMIDVTPDAVPYLGEDHRMPGLFYATGLSGHGFGIGPAIGKLTADLVAGSSPGHDLTRFRTNRFFDGSEIVPGPY